MLRLWLLKIISHTLKMKQKVKKTFNLQLKKKRLKPSKKVHHTVS